MRATAFVIILLSCPSLACDFCMPAGGEFEPLQSVSAKSRTIAVGSVVQREGRAVARFRVKRVLRGPAELAGREFKLPSSFFLSPKADYLLVGAGDAPQRAIQLGGDTDRYLAALIENADRDLSFHFAFIRHPDFLVSSSARQAFADAPYAKVRELAATLDADQLISWAMSEKTPPTSRGILLLLTGIRGNATHARKLEALLPSPEEQRRPGYDALLTAYLLRTGNDGRVRVERILDALPADQRERAVVAYLRALRFLEREETVLERMEILDSIRGLLRFPECAEATLFELRRLQDWSSREAVLAFQEKNRQEHPWIDRHVSAFLAACPASDAADLQLRGRGQ